MFLYGMQSLREQLEEVAGRRMKQILEKMTETTFRGFFAGTAVTATVQSSSAVMVILVSLVDSGILTLRQVCPVILGANVGTTITGQIIALDLDMAAPLMAFFGVLILIFTKKKFWQCIGSLFSGLGVMFIGLSMMEYAMAPLGESERFLALLENCRHPLKGIFAGLIFTALIQSSSASVGILQTLARQGIVDIRQSIPIVFGQNLGTCITAFFASVGGGINARRTALVHLLINLLGTVLFLILGAILPLADWMVYSSPDSPAHQIANVHTLFNMVTSLVLLPFSSMLAELAKRMVSDRRR